MVSIYTFQDYIECPWDNCAYRNIIIMEMCYRFFISIFRTYRRSVFLRKNEKRKLNVSKMNFGPRKFH